MIKQNIIFSGCSFTWGQGLYYCNKSFTDLKLPPKGVYDHSDKEFPSKEHKKFMEKNRFASLVSNHFDCIPVVRKNNGGSNTQIHRFVMDKLDSNTSFVIVQTTSFGRSESEPGGGNESVNQQINGLLKCLDVCESANIPIGFIHFDWESSLINDIPIKILEKTIKIKNKLSFYDTITDDDSDLIVGSDWKDEFPKSELGLYYDGHFNLKGHKFIAKQIINYIENVRT